MLNSVDSHCLQGSIANPRHFLQISSAAQNTTEIPALDVTETGSLSKDDDTTFLTVFGFKCSLAIREIEYY